MNSGTRIAIDAREFNIWGITAINESIGKFLNNDKFETSAGYLHTVSTVFAVEALTDIGNTEQMHYNWLVGDYSKAIDNYNTPEYKSRIWELFEQYKTQLRKLISNHTEVQPYKAYTADFKDATTLLVREVSLDTVNDSITEIF